jgi:hypothetical protein
MVWVLLTIIGGILTIINPHPKTTGQELLFAVSYLALVGVGVVVIVRYVPKRPILRPTIHTWKVGELRIVSADRDHELACDAEDRLLLGGRGHQRPKLTKPDLVAYFTDDVLMHELYGRYGVIAGTSAEYDALARQCRVRQSEMYVGDPIGGRAVSLENLYRLIFGDDADRAILKAEKQ